MKNIEDLKKLIAENIKEMKERRLINRSYSSISKKNEVLRFYISYLETNPNEDYLKSEKAKILNIINQKEANFNYWSEEVCSKDIPVAKRRALFNKEVGITDLKKRIKTLNYILS